VYNALVSAPGSANEEIAAAGCEDIGVHFVSSGMGKKVVNNLELHSMSRSNEGIISMASATRIDGSFLSTKKRVNGRPFSQGRRPYERRAAAISRGVYVEIASRQQEPQDLWWPKPDAVHKD
jgi:hypothetical protein